MTPEQKLAMDLMFHERNVTINKDPKVPEWTETRSGEYLPKTNIHTQKEIETNPEAKKMYSDLLKKYDAIKNLPTLSPKMEEGKKEYLKAIQDQLITSGMFQVG